MTTVEAPRRAPERFADADCAPLRSARLKSKAGRVVVADEAVIIASGKGVRLRPYTTLLPTPLVPIGDKYSVLELILRQLANSGFSKVTLAIGHLGKIVDAYVGDGSQFGLEVRCLNEESPVGTLGSVLHMLDSLPENFLVMNADLLTDLSYRGLLDAHIASDAPLTVAASRREYHVDFGVLDIADRQIQQLREKPSLSYSVNMGIYGVRREALRDYEPGQSISFDALISDLITKGSPPNAYEFEGYWADIGRHEDYDKANEEFAAREHQLVPGAEMGPSSEQHARTTPIERAAPLRDNGQAN